MTMDKHAKPGLYVTSVYRKHIVRHGPYRTQEDAERAKWYLETVQRHKQVTIAEYR